MLNIYATYITFVFKFLAVFWKNVYEFSENVSWSIINKSHLLAHNLSCSEIETILSQTEHHMLTVHYTLTFTWNSHLFLNHNNFLKIQSFTNMMQY